MGRIVRIKRFIMRIRKFEVGKFEVRKFVERNIQIITITIDCTNQTAIQTFVITIDYIHYIPNTGIHNKDHTMNVWNIDTKDIYIWNINVYFTTRIIVIIIVKPLVEDCRPEC